ncbi:MAG: SAM-dependent methyltransferase [Rhizobacter sp.]
MSRGRLILVPNTLDFGVSTEGDPQDVLPLGALRTAARLGHWVAENAKTTRAFLKRVDAIVPLAQPLQALSIVELPRPAKGGRAPAATPDLKPLLQPALDGHDIGLISEAGLPAIADPGAALVQAAHALSIEVLPLAGPSSLLMALGASGLNGQSFAFVGYLPVDAAQRGQRIRELEALSHRAGQTQIMIETPYRNEALLGALLAHLKPDSWLSVSSGLTLPGAWTRTARVSAWKSSPRPVANDVPAVFSLLAG